MYICICRIAQTFPCLFPNCWLTLSPAPCGQGLFCLLPSEARLIPRSTQEHRWPWRERYFYPPRAVIQLGGWKAVISSVYVWMSDRRSLRRRSENWGRNCWPKQSWRCPWLSLVFVPGEWRHSGGRWGAECRLTERSGIFRSCKEQLLGVGLCVSVCICVHTSSW